MKFGYAALALGLAHAVACTRAGAPEATASAASQVERGAPVDFSFPPEGDQIVSSETMRGRATVLAFVTTYDLASQLMLRRLAELIVKFTPRSNAAAIVVEPPLYAELLPTYRESMQLPFPVVMADFATQSGRGYFGNLERVPTLVVLDRECREIWRHQGQVESAEIEAALRRALSAP
jgi:hypothetical protein